MANITLSTTLSNLVVDSTNNIISVTSTPNTVVVGESVLLDNAQIRSALSNVAPILYDVSTGVFSFDANATFSGKTTDDLAEGTTNLYFTPLRARSNISATTATGISYNNGTGIFSLANIPNSSLTNSSITINGTAVSLGGTRTLTTTDIAEGTNLYFTAARARGNVSAVDAGGLGSFTYSSATGAFTYTGPSDSDIRNLISIANTSTGHGNISYNNSTGVITFDRVTPANILSEITAGNVKLKQYSETYYNAGNVSGAVTLNVTNGSIQRLTLVGNVTALNFTGITAGSTVTLIIRQDTVGFRILNTTGWTNWDFVGDNTTLTADPNAYDILTVTYDGTTYFASLVNFNTPVIQNSQLANSNVIVNGVTIALGSQGNIDTFNSNVTVNGNLNVTGNLNYQNVTDLYVTDQKITLNSNAATNANVELISNRPTATSTSLKWNEQSTRWEFTNNGTTYYPIPASTTDLAEGSNLWFTTGRANSAIDNRLVGGTGISYSVGTIALDFTEFDTGNITEGTNLYFTPARVRGNISAAENITYNSTTGVIGMSNSLANVSTITAQAGQNLTLNTANGLITQQKYSNTNVFSGNISSDGYALFTANQYGGEYVTYTGSANIQNYMFEFGSATAGSNAITGVSLLNYFIDAPESLSNAQVGLFIHRTEFDTIPFPIGTRVTSVDAANSIIYVNQNATATTNISLNLSAGVAWGLTPALHDSETGLTIGLVSEYDAQISASKTTLAYDPSQLIYGTFIFTQSRYGYPATGPVITDFDFTSSGTNTDYSLGPDSFSSLFIGRNKIESPKSVFQAPRGLIVGESADLTNRAENDTLPSFGVNVLWDGQTDPTEYNGNTPLTQILVKNYTDNNLQSVNRTNLGPRLMFIAAEGNASESIAQTYPLKNLELGRVSWWSTSSTSGGLSTGGPPAWISGVTGQDCVNNNSGVGMYFGISPNTANFNRSLFLASSMGNTLIASAQDSTGTHRPIIFAPSYFGSEQGNSALLYNQTITGSDPNTSTNQTSGAHFAQINYNNPSSLTGAKISVTNGNNTNSTREGNITLSIDRNLTSANANVRVRTGGVNFIGTSNPDRIRFSFAPQGLVDGTAVTINNFAIAPATTLNGNVFYVKGPFVSGSFRDYELYYDSGLTSGVNLGTTNVTAGPGTFEYTRNNAVTAKEWSWVLPQGSNDLILAEDGVTTTTFASGGNVSMNGNLTITGRHTYDRVYGEFFSNVAQTANAANTPTAITLNNTGISSDISIVNNSNITIAKPGNYNLQFSLQLANSDNSNEHDLDVWLRKNGTNVPNTNTQYTIVRGRSGASGKNVAALNLFLDAAAGDVYELVFAVTNTAVSIEAIAELTTPYARPATPSAIVTVAPIGA